METFQENELKCNWSGNIHSQSSQVAEPLWTYPGLKSGIAVPMLITTEKEKKKKNTPEKELKKKLHEGNDS